MKYYLFWPLIFNFNFYSLSQSLFMLHFFISCAFLFLCVYTCARAVIEEYSFIFYFSVQIWENFHRDRIMGGRNQRSKGRGWEKEREEEGKRLGEKMSSGRRRIPSEALCSISSPLFPDNLTRQESTWEMTIGLPKNPEMLRELETLLCQVLPTVY